MVIPLPAVPVDDHHMMIASVVGQQDVHPVLVSHGDLREFLDYSTGNNMGCVGVSKSLGLSIAFGIAGSVLFGAIGAAVKFVSDKVEEQRNSK